MSNSYPFLSVLSARSTRLARAVRTRRAGPYAVLAGLALAGAPLAQDVAFESPGMSRYGRLGQTTRFSTEFNPAVGFVIDGFTDYVDNDEADGFDAELRLLEFNAAAYVDPKAWAYVVLSSEGGEAPGVEEAALIYTGFEHNTTLKAGQFFLDFGKQMQWHPEELRTLERPLVLREFLGEELAGTGLQVGHWLPVGETSVVRFSAAAFSSLLGEGHGHGEEEEEGEEPEGVVPDRKDIDELSFAARVTGMTDVGESGQLQLGLSGRLVPEFAFELDDLEAGGLSNAVYGFDVTYGQTDETGLKSLLLGAEYLVFDGDLAAEVDDPDAPTSIDVLDDTVTGAYLYADYAWDQWNSVGAQYSFVESPEDPEADASELDFYYTRHLTEFRRARLGVTLGDSDELGDEFRVYLQFTAFFGTHSHGLDW